MHNWKRSGHGLGYALAALITVSCGGGGGGLLDLTGKSDNVLAFVTNVSAAIPVSHNGGKVGLVIALKDKSGAGVPNQKVTLKISGPATFVGGATTTSATTSATLGQIGNITFQIVGGSTLGKGKVEVTYTDTAGNEADPLYMEYEVVDPANSPSVYSILDPIILDTTGAPLPGGAGGLILPTSGNTTATIKLRVADQAGVTTNTGRLELSFPADGATGKGVLNTTKPSFTAESDGSYSAIFVLDASKQAVGDNRIIVTYTDAIGSKTTSTIPFSISNQFNVLLTADKAELKTGGDTLKLSAVVLDGASGRVPGQTVSFRIAEGMPLADAPCPANSAGIGDPAQFNTLASRKLSVANKGNMLPSSAVTDASGVAASTFDVADARNGSRRIYAVVEAASGTVKPVACLDIKLAGTKIQLQPEIVNTASGVAFPVTAKVTDGLGNTIPNFDVQVFGSGVAAAKSGKTLANGTVSFTLTPSAAGGSLSAASPSQAVAVDDADALPQNEVSVGVSSRNLAVTVEDALGNAVSDTNPATIGSNYTVRIKASDAGVPLAGKVVASTSLGTLTLPASTTLDAGGNLAAVLSSVEPGVSYVNIRLIDPVTNKVSLVANEAVRFAATVPNKITALAARTTLDRQESTEIVAKVLDKDDYPVANQWVEFRVTGDTSGGSFTNGTSLAQTNADGIATVSYTAGTVDTAKDNIRIRALVTSNKAIVSKDVLLTVSGSPVSVTLATGNTITELDETTYAKPYQVMVTNASGGPVSNQEVLLTIIPTYYHKGFYYWDSAARLWIPKAVDHDTVEDMTGLLGVSGADTVLSMPPIACPNEDSNLNGILDPGEDVNGDGFLWPLNPVTVSSKIVKTNSSGYATFDVIYGKSFGNWLSVRLIASTRVSGSEATSDRDFVLSVLSTDVNQQSVTPPGGVRSPFGQSQAIIKYTEDTTVTPSTYRPTLATIKTGSAACRLKINEGGILTDGLPN